MIVISDPSLYKVTLRRSGKSYRYCYVYVNGVEREKSYSAYCSAFKKATGGKPFKKFNYRQNTAANRKKYL